MTQPVYNKGDANTSRLIKTGLSQLDYLNTFTMDLGRIMAQLKDERNKEKAIARLENLRREILVVLGRENEYYIIPPPSDRGILPHIEKEGGKIILKSRIPANIPESQV